MAKARTKAVNTYTVTYERDEAGWWVASVQGVPGCHTQGRSLAETRRRIREALGLFVSHADKAELVDDVKLPTTVRDRVKRYLAARQRAEEEQARVLALATETVQSLRKELQLSVRDTGEVLGLSFQRVQQLSPDP